MPVHFCKVWRGHPFRSLFISCRLCGKDVAQTGFVLDNHYKTMNI